MKLQPRMQLENTGLAALYRGAEDLFYKWFNDERIYLHMGDIDPFPIGQSDALQYVTSHKKDTWLIVAKKDDIWFPIGYVGLFIRSRHRVGIIRYAIGNADYISKGYTKKAVKLVLAWAFKELDLESILASVSSVNIESKFLLEKLGFSECGIYHDARLENGKRYNEIHFEMQKQNYHGNNL